MKTYRLGRLFLALSASALLAIGCGDDDKKKDGSNSVGPTGDGTVITADNAGDVQAAVFASIGEVAAKGPGTHKGAVSGKVKIQQSLGKAAQIDLGNIGGVEIGSLQISYSMDFDDYSDDGEIWYNGIVSYELSGGTNFNYNFDITVSGAYEGKVKGQISVVNGVYTGSWDLGNGQVFNF
jgi:hypothetical protein